MSEAQARITITGKDQASGEIKKATASVRELNKESAKVRTTTTNRTGQYYGSEDKRMMQSMSAMMKEVDTGGSMAKKTISEMEAESRRLTRQFENLQVGTDAFAQKGAQLRTVNAELRKMRVEASALSGKSGLRSAAEGVAGRFGLSLGSGMVAAGAALATTAIIGVAAESVKAAAALEQLETKARVVFESSFPDVNAEVEKIAASVHRARSTVLQFATDMGALMESNEIAGGTLAEMSTGFSQLAIDLASFYDTSDEEAFNAIRSGLVGMVMPMRRFGVDMTAAAMKAFVLEKGLKQTWEQLSTGQKMAVRYAFVMEKTTKAQGDAGRTAYQVTNQYKAMKDNVKVLFEELGQRALPLARVGLIGMNAGLKGIINNIDNFVEGIVRSMGPLGKFALLAMKVRSLTAGESVPKGAAGALGKIGTPFDKDKLQDWVDGIGGETAGKDGGADKLEQIRDAMADVGKTAREMARDVGRSMREMARDHEKAQEEIRGEMDQTAVKLREMGDKYDKLAEDWKRTVDKMNTATADLLLGADEKLSGLGDKIAEVQRKMESAKQGGGSVSVDLQDEYDRLLAERDREKAGRDAVAGKVGVGTAMTADTRKVLESKLEDAKKKEAEYLREIAAAKAAGGSVSVGMRQGLESARDRVGSLTGQLGVTQTEADAIYQERSGQTDTQRKFADMQKDAAERKKDHEDKTKELDTEYDKLKRNMQQLSDKAARERQTYEENRTQMALTRDAIREFESVWSQSMANVNTVTEETVKAMKERIEELKAGVEEWNSIMRDNAEATGGKTLQDRTAERGATRLVNERAMGGYTSGLTLVGERGPELIEAPSGTYVHNNRDTRKMMGGNTVNVSFPGMVIQKTADAHEVLRIVAREVQKLQLGAA